MSPMPVPPPISQDPVRIEICKDPDDLAHHAAALFVAQSGRALGAGRRFSVALSGGETPRRMYALLPEAHYSFQVVWPAVQVFFSDERCVPPDHPDSNYRMASQALLGKVQVNKADVHRMRGEDDPVHAAEAYEKEIRSHLGDEPRFDLVLLGMGEDGHTASLFEGSPALGARDRLVTVALDPSGRPRLTLTLDAINAARTVAVLVSGEGKSEIARRVLGNHQGAEGLPIQKVCPANGQLLWLLDQAAASKLEQGTFE